MMPHLNESAIIIAYLLLEEDLDSECPPTSKLQVAAGCAVLSTTTKEMAELSQNQDPWTKWAREKLEVRLELRARVGKRVAELAEGRVKRNADPGEAMEEDDSEDETFQTGFNHDDGPLSNRSFGQSWEFSNYHYSVVIYHLRL